MTDAERYALKDEAREAARELYMHVPQWSGNISEQIEAFADGAAWQAQRDEAKEPVDQ